MNVLEEVEQFIIEEQLFRKSDGLIVAVSGGGDSTALAHILHQLGYKMVLAHVHFGLRGGDADDDEVFVKQLASKLGFPFRSKAFDTTSFARDRVMSIQEAARVLRYQWFEALRTKEHCRYIAVGTNLNDQAETMIYNLAKGCGPPGLHGIRPSHNRIVRPLVNVRGTRIRRWLEENGLKWREDGSNASLKYARNRIRHNILPELEKINPALIDTLTRSSANFADAERAFEALGRVAGKTFIRQEKGLMCIDLKSMRGLEDAEIMRNAILRPFGFNRDVLNDIGAAIGKTTGKRFFSPTHVLMLEREQLFLTERSSGQGDTVQTAVITQRDGRIGQPIALRWTTIDRAGQVPEPDADERKGWFDFDLLEFPLFLRRWQAGDAFIPIGMKGHKKISDFLIDVKCPRTKKQDTFVLMSGSEIVWLVGYRIADPFKVRPETRRIFQIVQQ